MKAIFSHVVRLRAVLFTLVCLFLLAIPAIYAATVSVAGHRDERKIILIGGYDAPHVWADVTPNPSYQINRANEWPRWQALITSLLPSSDEDTLEVERLIETLGYSEQDVFILSYATTNGRYEGTPGNYNFTMPKYTAEDTCLASEINTKNIFQRKDPCYIEEPLLRDVAENISEIIEDSRNANAEFDIIGFSEGGAVAAYWAGALATDAERSRTNSIITISAPLQGYVGWRWPLNLELVPTAIRQSAFAQAPTKVPLYTIRNENDYVVRSNQAFINGAWNDSGNDIDVCLGDGCHDIRGFKEVAYRVAATLIGGKISQYDAAQPLLLNANPSTQSVEIYKPTFTQDTIASDYRLNIGSSTVTPGNVRGNQRGGTYFEFGANRYDMFLTMNFKSPTLNYGEYDLGVDPLKSHLDLSTPPTNIYDTETDAVLVGPGSGLELMLVIDSSPSMAGSRLQAAKDAAKMIVDLVDVGTKVGVVNFGGHAVVAHDLVTITDDTVRADLKAKIDNISQIDATSIGSGLQAGLSQLLLHGAPHNKKAMLLLSDGEENAAPYALTILPSVISAGVVVSTVGLGDADNALLQQIARTSGGYFRYAPDLQALIEIYNDLLAKLLGEDRIIAESGIAGSTPVDISVPIENNVYVATFSASWQTPTAGFDFSLRAPNGTVITPQTTDGDIRYIIGPTYAFYRVVVPSRYGVGDWHLLLLPPAQSALIGNEPYTVGATGEGDLRISATTDRATYNIGDPIYVGVLLEDPATVRNAQITATVDGTTILTLYDDGQHNDEAANDGVYASVYTDTFAAGVYQFRIEAQGNSVNGAFQRVVALSIPVEVPDELPSDLYVTVTGPTTTTPGDVVEYTVNYGNRGQGPAQDVTLFAMIDPLLFEGSTLSGADPYGDIGIRWDIGTVGVGSQRSFTLYMIAPRQTFTVGLSISSEFDGTQPPTPDTDLDNNQAYSQTQVFGGLYLPLVILAAESTTPLPTVTPTPIGPSIPSGHIAFASTANNSAQDIFVMNLDNLDVANITNNNAWEWAPNWSPDGAFILYVSDRDGDLEIFKANADGSNPIQLTHNTVYNSAPSWSPDGTKIAYKSLQSSYELYVMNADGSNPQLLQTSLSGDWRISWSPDGSKLLYSAHVNGDSELFTINIDGRQVTQLTNNTVDDDDAVWSPDGQRIAFSSGVGDASDIYVINADGSSSVRLTNTSANEFLPDWSLDGSKLLFSSNRLGYNTIFIMNTDGSNVITLDPLNGDSSFAVWKP